MKITKLHQTADGYWAARVGGVPVDNRFGVWGTPPDTDGRWKLVRNEHARRLQQKIRAAQKAVTA